MIKQPCYGFYGKIPAVGDFVHRSLPASTVASLDEWLREGMYLGGQQGQAFRDKYLASRVCFFVLPQHVWTEQAVAGFILPSADRVGRLFPLVFLQEFPHHRHIEIDILVNKLMSVSDAAIHALHQRFGPDELYRRLVAADDSVEYFAANINFDAFKSFSVDGKHSLWWRQSNAENLSTKLFDDMDVKRIFDYLYP